MIPTGLRVVGCSQFRLQNVSALSTGKVLNRPYGERKSWDTETDSSSKSPAMCLRKATERNKECRGKCTADVGSEADWQLHYVQLSINQLAVVQFCDVTIDVTQNIYY